MSANLADFAKLTTAANAAKYQGSGTGGWGTAFKYLGALAGPLAGAQQTGIVPAFLSALGNVGQVKNESAYNQYLKTVAEYEKASQEAENANSAMIGERATGIKFPKITRTGANGQTYETYSPINTKFLAEETEAIRQNNANADRNRLLGGENLQWSPYSAANDNLTLETLRRRGAVTDSDEAQRLAEPLFNEGKDSSSVNDYYQLPNNGVLRQPFGLDTERPQSLTAGIQQTNIVPQTISPFLQPALPVSEILTHFRGGAEDRREASKQEIDRYGNVTTRQHYQNSDTEAVRHNKATEAIGQTNAQSDRIRANKYQPGSTGSQNPLTTLKSIHGIFKGQVEAIDKQLRTFGFMDKKGNIIDPNPDAYSTESSWFDGKKATTTADLSKRKMAKALLQKREQILENITGTLPFGGQSPQKLDSVGTGFTEWKRRKATESSLTGSHKQLSELIYPGRG